jgi:hypothetical protein
MNATVATWLFFRVLRWASWIVFLGFSFWFAADQTPYLNSFGHLLPIAEVIMFGTSTLAVFAGFFELAMRERAGIQRPKLGELMPPRGTSAVELAR